MGFKTCSQDEFDKAIRNFDKFNRKNKSTENKLPTLAEQLAALDVLEEKQRQERLKKAEEQKNEKRFSPLYEAKLKSEQSKPNKK